MRSIAILQKVPASINKDDLAGHKIAFKQIEDRYRDIPGPAVTLEWHRM
jgi:hypothetical protein